MSPSMIELCSLQLASRESTACRAHSLMKQNTAEKPRDKEKHQQCKWAQYVLQKDLYIP